eukprot:Gb_11270 [translate_table: standard]
MDVVIYSTMMSSFCKHWRIHDARVMLAEMPERGIEPTNINYNVLIKGFCKEGHMGKVQEVAELFQTLGNKGCILDVAVYNIMLDGFCKGDMVLEAEKLFEKMNGRCCHPNAIT